MIDQPNPSKFKLTSPDWATANIELRRQRDEMDAMKKRLAEIASKEQPRNQ